MKRLYASFFLLIFLLNVLGYYGVFLGLRAKAGNDFTARINSEMYDLGSTMTIRVPVSIPYATSSDEYVAANGKFELNGEVYQIVKQRISDDALYIVCIKDQKSSDVHQAMVEFVQGFAGSEDGSSDLTLQAPIKDFVHYAIDITSLNDGWVSKIAPFKAAPSYIDSFFGSVIHPPERA